MNIIQNIITFFMSPKRRFRREIRIYQEQIERIEKQQTSLLAQYSVTADAELKSVADKLQMVLDKMRHDLEIVKTVFRDEYGTEA